MSFLSSHLTVVSKLSRIEAAGIAISGDDTYTLCGVLGVGEDLKNALVALARQAKRRDWSAYRRSVIGRRTDLLELEADCTLTHSFTLDVVPGPLQTDKYARALMRHGMPRESEDSIEQRVAMRMQRQTPRTAYPVTSPSPQLPGNSLSRA